MGRSFLYEFSLLWVFPITWSGFFRKIDSPERAPQLPASLKAEVLVPQANEIWEEQVRTGKPSLPRLVYKLSRIYVIFGLFMSLIQGLTTTVFRPLIIRQLVNKLNQGGHDAANLLPDVGFIALTLIAEGWSGVSLKHALSDYLGTIWFTSVGSLVSAKSLSIPSGVTRLQESSLLGNDILRGYENLRFASIVFMAFIALIGGIIVLIITIGESSIIGLSLMVAILFANGRLAKRAQLAEEADLEAADERLSLMSEIISGIKAIKLSAWEDSYMELIRKSRQNEMKCLGLYRTLHQSSVQLGRACPALCAGVSFIYLATTKENLNAADLFAALNVFLALRLPLIIIPESVTYIGGFWVSFERLERYLLLDEISDAFVDFSQQDRLPSTHEDGECDDCDVGKMDGQQEQEQEQNQSSFRALDSFQLPVSKEAPAKSGPSTLQTVPGGKKGERDELEYTLHGSYVWHAISTTEGPNGTSEQHNFVLKDIDIKLPKGSKTAVIGRVGSGKSSLLCAMANEMREVDGSGSNTFAKASKGYVPQHSFILSGTIRDNLTLAKPLTTFGDDQFHDALHRAALEKDLQYFPKGLDTPVGERGVTLSGGQQARLSIARALFRRPELLIADDPLAAVDGPVGQHLVDFVIKDSQPGQTLVVALNQLKYLDCFDYVIELRAGSVAWFGRATPAEIRRIQQEELASCRELAASGQQHAPAKSGSRSETQDQVDVTRRVSSAGESTVSDLVSADGKSHLSSNTGEMDNAGDFQLVEKEQRNKGSISTRVIGTYAKGMGYGNIAFGVTTGLVTYTIMAGNDLWLAYYVAKEDPSKYESTVFSAVYASGCVAYLIFLLSTSVIFSRAGVRSSQHLHDNCMDRLLHAPISWFESTPSGRILARFSTDLGMVDQVLSRFTDNLFQLLATTAALIAVVCVLVPPVTIVILVSIVLFSMQVVAVDRSTREIKREANLAMSRVQTVLTESVNGRMTLRIMDAAPVFLTRFHDAADAWNRQSFLSLSMVNMSMLTSYALSFFISTGAGLFIVFGSLGASESGLALTYASQVPYFLLHCAFVFTIVQSGLSSLERIIDFTGPQVPQEPDWRLVTDPFTRLQIEKHRALGLEIQNKAQGHTLAQGDIELTSMPASELWPSQGEIEFHEVTLRYRPTLPPAVNKVSFCLPAGARLGVVGRSGAGKSSLLLCMFRILELSSGAIYIDKVDTSKIGLVTLREAFSVIPQLPLLLRGSIRKNLAPFGGRDDSLLSDVLLQSGLASNKAEAQQMLDLDVASRLSSGERQLLSFARTLLRPNSIRVLDESSSCMDDASDARMQSLIRSTHGTAIVIAHRVATIGDSDYICVMSGGKCVEYGPPQELLDKRGHYYKLAQASMNSSTS